MRWLLTAGLLLIVTFAVQAEGWTVYIQGRQFASVSYVEGELLVDPDAFAKAAGCTLVKGDDGVLQVNDQVVPVKAVDGRTLVPLKTIVEAAGGSLEMHRELQMAEVRLANRRTREDVLKEIVRARTITLDAHLNFLYGMTREALEQRLGMVIKRPITTRWMTLAELQGKTGANTYGYSVAKVRGEEVVQLELWVPRGMPAPKTLHAMAHELGHCWQYDNNILDADPELMEGFAEWAAGKILESLTLPGEIRAMQANLYSQYRDGFEHFRKIEREAGMNGVLEAMRRARR